MRLAGRAMLFAALLVSLLTEPALIRRSAQISLPPEPGLTSESPVLGVSVGGAARAYPLLALFGPEVVNDSVGGEPIVVTFCPLCFSGVVYARSLDGRTFSFAVSGTLERQVLVIRDRETQTRWSQLTGLAIDGPLRGKQLRPLPTQVITWRRWRERFPASTLYPGFRASSFTFSGAKYGLGAGSSGHTELVLGTRAGDAVRAYGLTLLDRVPLLEDIVGGVPLVVAYVPQEGFGLAWDRRLGERVLHFHSTGARLIVVDQDGGRWDLLRGEALSGPHAGAQLTGLWTSPAFAGGWARFLVPAQS